MSPSAAAGASASARNATYATRLASLSGSCRRPMREGSAALHGHAMAVSCCTSVTRAAPSLQGCSCFPRDAGKAESRLLC
ncbi:hypothetical protein FA09DRAFT_332347 [Tilletiopsis washingtonensis]|uniref:Uncharacterized protein n=1 Tax=Tilletiopsis washingtonensis TaxID=58919 RepID=A0A316Z1D0_9BASI|nr:hypothetical protein FA09DRAFT_332347 [Tilletiopsis washingtonensis]PWN95176.1 hypothetical protein FA09DRAFT_332347 [Tilletiopsis washingtonensis]